ncbi:MAG: helix-turn-helix domain-containing protein [Verrucomicrobiota bacterium JB022]|nr:helix-turn-helix domain-containing protein [Verrucomicrobiota bacterium JB022]
MFHFDPSRPDFAPYGFTCVRWVPSLMKRPDHHNEIELNLLWEGSVTYLLGAGKVQVEAGQLSLFWAAIPHQIIDFSENAGYFVVTIPFAWFLQFRLPERIVQPLLRGEMVQELDPARRELDLRLVEQWERDLGLPGTEPQQVALAEMEARLRRLALTHPTDSAPDRATNLAEGGLNKAEQMALFIARRYTEPLTVEAIAGAVELHPNYAMGLFRTAFGTTLMDYLLHHRVSHAQRLLATTDRKIVDLALESGFSSLSRFNDAFRKTCGVTPREYRRQHAVKV